MLEVYTVERIEPQLPRTEQKIFQPTTLTRPPQLRRWMSEEHHNRAVKQRTRGRRDKPLPLHRIRSFSCTARNVAISGSKHLLETVILSASSRKTRLSRNIDTLIETLRELQSYLTRTSLPLWPRPPLNASPET